MSNCSINLKHNSERKRAQYFCAPFASMFVMIGLAFVLKIAAIFSPTMPEINKSVIGLMSQQVKQEGIQTMLNKQEMNLKLHRKHPNRAFDSVQTHTATDIKIHVDQPKELDDFENNLNISISPEIITSAFSLFALAMALFGMSSIILVLYQAIFTAAILLCTKKYPRFIFEWNKNVLRYYYNFIAYNWLLIDKLPNIDGSENQLEITVPDAPTQELSRFLPLVKWLLVIIQLITISLIRLALIFIQIIIWPYLIISCNPYPKRLQQYILGFFEWELTVLVYSQTMFTDEYPKFTFKSKTD